MQNEEVIYIFDSTNVTVSQGGTNIKVNAISGTLVKNYKDSFMLQIEQGNISRAIFSMNPRLKVSRNTQGCYEEKEWFSGEYHSVYYKDVVVIQSMILSDGLFLCELMWKDDFDKMFEPITYGNE